MTQHTESLAELHHLEWVAALVEVEHEHRDRAWLEHALQAAVSVEFSTIPPYLSALWSIKDECDEVAASIRNVVQEEMLHMALACNMLTAVGGVPKIADPRMVPTYPGHIPGGVHAELLVTLSGLSDASLDVFIEIEAPAEHDYAAQGKVRKDTTIGQFYNGILDTFRMLEPELSTERQIAGPLAYMVMEDLSAVERAIALIKSQGEGSEVTAVVEHSYELAHYYRFREIREGHRLSSDDPANPEFDGPPIQRPDVWPMAVVPEGGYKQPDVPGHVWAKIETFDRTFTQLLNRLQSVWENGDQGAMIHAIETMFGLSDQARSLMSIEIDGGAGNYGPCFRYLEDMKDQH